MSNKTVRQLAEVVKIPLERLLEQLKEAGLSACTPDDVINEDEKMQLLAHLRNRHGKDMSSSEGLLKRMTLKHRTVSELNQADIPSNTTKTINVEAHEQNFYMEGNEAIAPIRQRNKELVKQAPKNQVSQQAEKVSLAEELVKMEEIIVEPTVKSTPEAIEIEVTLDALKQDRLDWTKATKKNSFDVGINRLLTELYPDNAHFNL